MGAEFERSVPPRPSGEVALLDCTLRDGGYYNDWDFPPPLIRRYVRAIARARVPYVELGFRTVDPDRYFGPTAHTTDRFLNSIDLPDSVTFGVMVNAKEVVAHGDPVSAVDRVFGRASESRVRLVRIASGYSDLVSLRPAIERLQELGYSVGVNLMQIAARTPYEIAEFGRHATEWGVDVAYVADSFGAMQPDDVPGVVAALRSTFTGPVGCHMHDNMSLALVNTMTAIEAGVAFVDSTLLGMGRGPGNVRTEYLAIELARRGLADLDVVPLLATLSADFVPLRERYGWGTNVYYYLSAVHGVHPTYIQELTSDGRYSVDEIVAALEQLSQAGGSSYSAAHLEAAANSFSGADSAGTWDATGWCAGRRVLIVGPGPGGQSRRDDIEGYIKAERPVVVALNAVPPVSPSLVDLYAICHPVRALIDADTIKGLEGTVVMPSGVQAQLGAFPEDLRVRDYGMVVEPARFAVDASSCVVPRMAAFPYALAIVMVGGAEEILLTGFDGFEPADPRQDEMLEIIRLFAELEGAPQITALTPTSYPVNRSSIYSA